MELAAREHRLEQIAGIHRCTFGLTRADHVVELVDEQNDPPVGFLDRFQDGFEPLFELAAIFRVRNESAHIERNDLLVFQSFGNVAAHDALREPFRDRRLANAGLFFVRRDKI